MFFSFKKMIEEDASMDFMVNSSMALIKLPNIFGVSITEGLVVEFNQSPEMPSHINAQLENFNFDSFQNLSNF